MRAKRIDKDKERTKTMKNNKKMTPVYPFKRFNITAIVLWDYEKGETPPDPKFEVSFTPEELMNEDVLDKGGIDDINKWFIDEKKLEEFLGEYLTDFTDFCHKGFTFEWDYVQ